jgi:hypothetical protein
MCLSYVFCVLTTVFCLLFLAGIISKNGQKTSKNFSCLPCWLRVKVVGKIYREKT